MQLFFNIGTKEYKNKIWHFFLFAMVILITVFSFMLISCKPSTAKDMPNSVEVINTNPLTVKFNIEKEKQFSSVYLSDVTCDQFNNLGFSFGNSLNVYFSNGEKLIDIPYVDGFYVAPGEYNVCSNKAYSHPTISNNIENCWNILNCKEGDTVQIEINKDDGYKDVCDALSMKLDKNPDDGEYDTHFSNFRSLSGGNIKEGRMFRSASPCNNQDGRAGYVNSIMNCIYPKYIIDLADSKHSADSYENDSNFVSYYWKELKDANLIYFCGCSPNYQSDEFRTKIISALTEMTLHNGPYWIHCTEGKDRTGFVCFVLEALNGASFDQVKNDYLISYINLFKLDVNTDKDRLEKISDNLFLPMASFLTGMPKDTDFSKIDLSTYAKNYLLQGGMSSQDIDKLCLLLCT